jgi:NAD-dependent deacetylase
MMIATQNIDGLHQRAGSRNVVEIHGSIWRTRCTRTGQEFEEGEVPVEGGPFPPRTPSGALLRPAVVWFGEMLPREPIERIETFLEEPPDLALVIGTSAAFGYIIQWALRAKSLGATLVEINLDPTDLSPAANFTLRAPAGQVLPDLVGGKG